MTDTLEPGRDDLTATPWHYPGTAAPHGGLLHDGRFLRLVPAGGRPVGEARVDRGLASWGRLDDVLRRCGGSAAADRYLVVAVGSNASPAVLHRKLARAGASTTVPMVAGTVTDLAVGHTARVSSRGYLAAAPVYGPGVRTEVVVSLLDEDQLAGIDATEPGYVRRRVGADRCRLVLDGGERPAAFMLYDAAAGVIAPPEAEALLLGSQEEVFACLREDCTDLAALVGAELPYREVMRRLAGEADLRDAVRSCLEDLGWTTRSGFEDCPRGGDSRYGDLASSWAA